MSEHDEDLELAALQRQLDDAFETTRPRSGFEDELWLRMQQSRPAARRIRDALAGFIQAVREVPAVPAASVALILVVALVLGLLLRNVHFGGGGASTSAGVPAFRGADLAAGAFGQLPSPVFDSGTKAVTTGPGVSPPGSAEYAGPGQITWAGNYSGPSAAPVFRYQEPTSATADQFASSLGAVLRGRPAGFLGSYTGSGYTLNVRGTVQSFPPSPASFIFASLAAPPVQAAGASEADVAAIFLAQHNLTPQWSYTVSVDRTGDPVRVVYERQFEIPGFGLAYLVGPTGARYGIEVDISSNRPVSTNGVLPVNLDSAPYGLASPDVAIRTALTAPNAGTVTPPPSVVLTQVELVYVLVPAGSQSYYEPAYLFSGKVQLNGVTYSKHVLAPAVDPSQRKP